MGSLVIDQANSVVFLAGEKSRSALLEGKSALLHRTNADLLDGFAEERVEYQTKLFVNLFV